MKIKSIVLLLVTASLIGCYDRNNNFAGTFVAISSDGVAGDAIEFEGKKAIYAKNSPDYGYLVDSELDFDFEYKDGTVELKGEGLHYELEYSEGEHNILTCINCTDNEFSEKWYYIGDGMIRDIIEERATFLREKQRVEKAIAKEMKDRLHLLAKYDGTWVAKTPPGNNYIGVISISHKREDVPVKAVALDPKSGKERHYVSMLFDIEGDRLILEDVVNADPETITYVLDKSAYKLNCISCVDEQDDLTLDFSRMKDLDHMKRLAGIKEPIEN